MQEMNRPLLIVTEAFRIGGVETYIRGEIEALTSLGRKVHLVCGKDFDPTLVPSSVSSITSGLAIGPDATLGDLVQTVNQLRELIRQKDIGAIDAHPFTSFIPALACAEFEGLPLIVTLHGPSSVVGSYGAGYEFMQGSLVLPRASLVVAVSDEVRSLAQPFVGAGRIIVQPNAIEPGTGSDLSVTKQHKGRWLVVSRLDDDKADGIVAFVRAAYHAGIAGVDVCGSGDAESVAGRLASEIPSDFVQWLGARADVPALMGGYDGVAGMGRVALEGVVHNGTVCLIGYDGVKGILDEPRYRSAEFANLSGRGLPTVSLEEGVAQLRQQPKQLLASLRSIVSTERNAELLWGRFARELDALLPLERGITSALVEHLQAGSKNEDASALWSTEVMEKLGRLVAAHSTDDLPTALAYSIHSSAFNHAAADRSFTLLTTEVRNTRDMVHSRMGAIQEGLAASVEHLKGTDAGLHGLDSALQDSARSFERLQWELNVLRQGLVEQSTKADEWQVKLEAELSQLRQQGFKLQSHVTQQMEQYPNALASSFAAEIQRLIELVDQTRTLENEKRNLNDEVGRINEELASRTEELSKIYDSTSWRVTRPMRGIKYLIVEPGRTLRRIFSSKNAGGTRAGNVVPRSRFRSLLNFSRRTLANGRIDPSDRARLASIFRRGHQQARALLGQPRAQPSTKAEGLLADVYVWAVIDWHFRTQRPQHLAVALAKKGHRVFYISNNFIDSAAAGFVTEDLGCDGRLFQVNLHVTGAPQIYADMPDEHRVRQIRASLQELLAWAGSTRCISFVQHPYWLEPSRALPNSKLIYDCMDHHGGFENNASSILAGEHGLIAACDLLVVTSQWLHEELSPQARNIALIRNATEFSHFSQVPATCFSDARERKVIGYYGAIAEWFDADLIRAVAIDNPDALVLLVGRDTAEVGKALKDLPNVQMIGEVAYVELPYWLYGFDVCLLPFRVIPLTLATNPVKVYEYLSAGLPIVSVNLPEMAQFEGLVRIADDHDAFVAAVRNALQEGHSQAETDARRNFASMQTWDHRAADLDLVLENIPEPRVSVVVLTYNNLEYTKACLHSIETNSDYANLEVIVVDNASSDGSQDFLAEWARESGTRFDRRLILNSANLGFSAGNNVGLAQAQGDYLIVLNNDTYVSPGWIRTLVAHLRNHPDAGLVGPVTNNIGNEAKIEIAYSNMEEMVRLAGDYTRRHAGETFPIATAAFFCVMLTRTAYERVGGLDERFGIGFFEDDDYCRRMEQKGFQVLCAEDVFVHHHLSASFNKLRSEEKQKLFETNKAIYEEKWGPWEPHVYRSGRAD